MNNVLKSDIPGFEGLYYATVDGEIFSYGLNVWFDPQNKYIFRKGKELKQKLNSKGYFYVGLHKNKKIKNMFVHRILAICFIKNDFKKPHINHINGIKTDNRLLNLEWCTPKENYDHAIKKGLAKCRRGQDQHNSILTNKKVKQIKSMLAKGKKQREIANLFNVHFTTISDIKRNKSWKHIAK